jgi:tRNA(Ile)-lysidine synthase
MREPDEACAAAVSAVLYALESSLAALPHLDGSPPLVVVALSGGMDSMVLAHALRTLHLDAGPAVDRPNFDLLLAHFDHTLRPTSADDAAFVARAAAAWGLPLANGRRQPDGSAATPAGPPRHTGSVEADARSARYRFLAATARAHAAGRPVAVLTGHHAGDQLETLLLNLLRGSGVVGLAAIRSPAPLPEAPEIPLLRPFLELPQTTLSAYARAVGLAWRTDESNEDRTRTRNWLRHDLLPLLEQGAPGAGVRLLRTAALLADEAERLARLTESQLAPLVVEAAPGERIRLDACALAALPMADRRGVLRHALLRTFPDAPAPSFDAVNRLAQRLGVETGASGPHPLAGGLCWTGLRPAAQPPQVSLHRADTLPLAPTGPWLDGRWRAQVGRLPLPEAGAYCAGAWRLTLEPLPAAAFPGRGALAGPPWEVWLDAAAGPFALGTPLPGERMAPLGMGGHTRSLGNLFTDCKVAPALRPGWPLVRDAAGRIVWLCGLALAQTAALSPASVRALRLRWQPADSRDSD